MGNLLYFGGSKYCYSKARLLKKIQDNQYVRVLLSLIEIVNEVAGDVDNDNNDNYNVVHDIITSDTNSVSWAEIWEFPQRDIIDAVII